jgi:hypothetical protein
MKSVLLGVTLFCLLIGGAGAEGWFEEESRDTFRYDDCDRLVVDRANVFSVTVTGSSGSQIEGRIVAPHDSRLRVHHERRGDTIRLWVERRHSFFWWSSGEHRLELRVPRRCRVNIQTSTGRIEVEGVRDELDLRTDTGTITVADCRGEITARAGTGSLRFQDVEGKIAASADTGSISMAGFRGRLELRADTGSLTGEEVALTEDSSFETDTGQIAFELNNFTAELRFELSTDAGSIEAGGDRARRSLSAGSGPILVRARSDTGSIRFR